MQPVLHSGVVSEVIIHARDILKETEQRPETVNTLEKCAEEVTRVRVPESGAIDCAVRLARWACNLDSGPSTFMPVLTIANISCD